MSGFADQAIAEYLLGSTLSIISYTGVAKEGEDMSFVQAGSGRDNIIIITAIIKWFLPYTRGSD